MSEDVNKDKFTSLARTFKNHTLIAVNFEGAIVIVLSQLEQAWEYAPKGLAKQLGRWAEAGQVREGVHYHKLTGSRLSAFKLAIGDRFAKCEPAETSGGNQFAECELVGPQTRNLLVITERGLYRLLTLIPDKTIAIAFQDWLEADVLPALGRTGTYTVPNAAPPAEVTVLPAPPTILTAKEVRRLHLRDASEQLADTIYPRFSRPNPALIEAGLRQLGATRDLMEGLILSLIRSLDQPTAELLIAELSKLLSRAAPVAAPDAPAKEVPLAQARVLLDGAPEHVVLHALLHLNAIHSAMKGPWLGHHEEMRRTAEEMYRLSQRITHKRDRWQKDLDHVAEDLETAMRRHPESARLLALVVREIADRDPEAWAALLFSERGHTRPPRNEGALISLRRRGGAG